MNSNYIFIFFFIILVCSVFFWKLDKIAKIIDVYDYPDNYRKIHTEPVPLIGGLLILLGSLIIIFWDIYLNDRILLDYLEFNTIRELFCFVTILILIFLVGIYDDKYNVDPLKRILLLSFLCYFYLIFSNQVIINRLDFDLFNLSISFGNEGIFITLLCFITLLNILNFYDGLNLQLIFYSLLIFFYLYLKTHNDFFLFFIFPLLTLFVLNYKNRIFLGDSGAYLLGFLLSVFLLKSYNMGYVLDALEIFSLLSLPFFDTLRVIIGRVYTNKQFYNPDMSHFHHLLIKKFGQIKAIKIMFFLNLVIVGMIFYNFIMSIVLSFLVIFFGAFLIKKSTNETI